MHQFLKDEPAGLLLASDFITVFDAERAFNELLPRLTALNISDVDEIIKEIHEFTSRTGIDLSKAKNVALGLRNHLKSNSNNNILLLRISRRRIGQTAVPEQSASELKLRQVVFALPL